MRYKASPLSCLRATNECYAITGPNISLPHCETSTLELISPDGWVTMDGYVTRLSSGGCGCDLLTGDVARFEFAANEFVNCVVSVPLETMSTEFGMKDFIAVGTTINRGEDLAVKGAVSSLCHWPQYPGLTSPPRYTSSRSSKWCRIRV